MAEAAFSDCEVGGVSQEAVLEDLASAVENLLMGQSNQTPQAGSVIWGVYSGLSRVLDLIQTVLKDGSLCYDFRGREECRTFVLEETRSQVDMFGSSSIEGWLQLQLSNQKLTQKLRDLFADRDRVALHYTPNSICLNPVLRQTFLLILESLEELDLDRLASLNLKSVQYSTKSPFSSSQKSANISTSGTREPDTPTDTDTNNETEEIEDYSGHQRNNSLPVSGGAGRNPLLSRPNISFDAEGGGQHRCHRRSVSCPEPMIGWSCVPAVLNQLQLSQDQTLECPDDLAMIRTVLEASSISDEQQQNFGLSDFSPPDSSRSLRPIFTSSPANNCSTNPRTLARISANHNITNSTNIDNYVRREGNMFYKGHARASSDSTIVSFVGRERPISSRRANQEKPNARAVEVNTGRRSDEMDSSQEIKGSWSRIVPATTGDGYPRPRANQSLISFLTESGSRRLRRATPPWLLDREDGTATQRGVVGGLAAELDRENAHFILSEAMIGTLEQVAFERKMRRIELQQQQQDECAESSDEEIRELKIKLAQRRALLGGQAAHTETGVQGATSTSQRRRTKRPARHEERSRPREFSDGRTDVTTNTDQSGSVDEEEEEEDSRERKAYDESGHLIRRRRAHANSSLVLDSNDEEFAGFERGSAHYLGQLLADIPEGSAEGIALSLLGQVGAGRLPPADRLPWLVSECEAPQALLPLPDALPVDPDHTEDLKGATELRGNLSWAPPRPQIVLTVQVKPRNRQVALFSQKFQCSGCGLRVEQKYSKSFRFCHYLGKFFCTGCHEEKTSLIPAKIIHHWDFKKYAVSNFALEILVSMWREPVFNISDLNPGLTKKVEKVKTVCLARAQLKKLFRYTVCCRHAQTLCHQMETYDCADVYTFSMEQLFKTRFEKLGKSIRRVVGEGLEHVKHCELCQARAYICEGCHATKTIFPFQAGVTECLACSACYHQACYKQDQECFRCKRIRLRGEKGVD